MSPWPAAKARSRTRLPRPHCTEGSPDHQPQLASELPTQTVRSLTTGLVTPTTSLLPQNKDQVLVKNTVPPGCLPQVLSQFLDSPPPNLAPVPPHQTLPPAHFPLPTNTQAHFFSSPGPHFYSLDSNSDFGPLPNSSSLPRSSSCFHQNSTYFGDKLPSPHSTPPSNYQLCLSPPLTSVSQLQNSPPPACQSPSLLQDFQISQITSPSPSSPCPGRQSNKQAQQVPQPTSFRCSGVPGRCVPSKVDPAEFKGPGVLAQALAVQVGRRRIAQDLKIQFLQRMWLGTSGPAPVVEYPVCLVCLQPRTPSCPILKYKTIPRLIAFPQLLPRSQECGPLRMGIGFGLRLSRRQAMDLHLRPKNNPEGAVSGRGSPVSKACNPGIRSNHRHTLPDREPPVCRPSITKTQPVFQVYTAGTKTGHCIPKGQGMCLKEVCASRVYSPKVDILTPEQLRPSGIPPPNSTLPTRTSQTLATHRDTLKGWLAGSQVCSPALNPGNPLWSLLSPS